MTNLNYKNLIIFFSLILFTGCAKHYASESTDDPYGVFSGIWHGVIAPLTITVNLLSWLLSIINISFLEGIQIIGRPNTGLFYYLGFFVGFLFICKSNQ
jgi:hypothetical protein